MLIWLRAKGSSVDHPAHWPFVAAMQTVAPFNDDQLAINRIIQRPNGTFHCELCWKNPECMWRVRQHVGSKDHKRRMANMQYQEDPVAYVPYPHREFTELRNGWATCKICDSAMVENHWKSEASRQEPCWLRIPNVAARTLLAAYFKQFPCNLEQEQY